MTGIAEAYCYPLRQGLGSVDLAALHEGSGSARLLLAGEITDLQATIDALRPVDVTFRVLTVEATDVDVEVTIVPNGDALYAFDWDDSTPLEASTWTAGTKTLSSRRTARRACPGTVGSPSSPPPAATVRSS